jgi:uncharacterized protein (TIGR03083 family)
MTDSQKLLQALSASQQRLALLVKSLQATDLQRPTSDHGWNVAEVLSHLGSQSEIFTLFVEAGLNGTQPPSNDSFGPIWDAWNAKSPEAMAADSLAADAAFLEDMLSLDEEHLDRFELSIFGMEVDAARLLGMRLGEHSLHSWDVEVVFDEKALLAADATELLVDGLDLLVSRAGKPEDEPESVSIITSSPERRFVLDTGVVSLAPGEAAPDAPKVELSSEGLIRLVYGRLDDRHLGVPAPKVTSVELDRLRAIFPGV